MLHCHVSKVRLGYGGRRKEALKYIPMGLTVNVLFFSGICPLQCWSRWPEDDTGPDVGVDLVDV